VCSKPPTSSLRYGRWETEKNFIISTLSRPKDIYERCVRKSKANGWALNKLKPALSVMMNKSKWWGRDAAVGGITRLHPDRLSNYSTRTNFNRFGIHTKRHMFRLARAAR